VFFVTAPLKHNTVHYDLRYTFTVVVAVVEAIAVASSAFVASGANIACAGKQQRWHNAWWKATAQVQHAPLFFVAARAPGLWGPQAASPVACARRVVVPYERVTPGFFGRIHFNSTFTVMLIPSAATIARTTAAFVSKYEFDQCFTRRIRPR
jgi:hypothetical protein